MGSSGDVLNYGRIKQIYVEKTKLNGEPFFLQSVVLHGFMV